MLSAAVRRFLEEAGIGPCGLVAAVSGGADSTALLLALAELRPAGFSIVCAHVNHHLRGAEADADETFVRDLCSRLEVTLRIADGTLDPDSVRRHGIEAAAREVRTHELLRIRNECGADWVATAHQQNDQAETILMRLASGTGPAGLRGIHPIREDGFIRPFLDVPRSAIESALAAAGISPRRDTMNADPRFLRTRVRKALARFSPGEVARIARIAGRARAEWMVLECELDQVEDVDAAEDRTVFHSLPTDARLRQALLLRHIRRLGGSSRDISSNDLERLAGQAATLTRVSVTGELELLREHGRLVLRRCPRPVESWEAPIGPGETVRFGRSSLTLRPAAADEEPSAEGLTQLFQLPPGASPRFEVRNRRPGDRFRPLGMAGTKKLKDFLIDRKVPREERDRIPLLTWEGRIVWVAGLALSDEFRASVAAGYRYVATLGDEEGTANDPLRGRPQ